MSKNQKTPNTLSNKFKLIKVVGDIAEYELKSNGLRVLYKNIPGTGVITTNLTYLVGSRDEQAGETGVAHMLEHMLFKPTKFDLKNKSDAGAMKFEREVGPVLNANTWCDRTTYYFSYGKEHYQRAIKLEAERMREVVLSDKEFLPERTNVLSEFDMYNGDPHFALSLAMSSVAFLSHPYGHETIGFREDIEAYTTTKLQKFYNHFYRPNNAVLMVIGDIEFNEAAEAISEYFGGLLPEPEVKIRPDIIEPKQEGKRTLDIKRPGTTNILAIGFKHPGFPTAAWHETMIALKLISDNADSVLQKKLVDTGLASKVSANIAPLKDASLGTIFITLTEKSDHQKMEKLALKLIREVDFEYIKNNLKTIITKTVSDEIFSRDSSLDIAAELTEYVSAGDWTAYFETEKILKGITAKDIKSRIEMLFEENSLTIGNYISN
jgi:zinc protease